MFHDFFKRTHYLVAFARKKMIHLNLQILYRCNFTCDICDFWKAPYKDQPQLSVAQIQVIAEKLKKVGPLVVSIGGGEPLLHKDLIELTGVLSENNFPVMICNGWFVTPEKARALFAAGMYEVSISVDYADAEKHDRQRGKDGAFKRAIQALTVLNQNRTQPHQRVHMISVVMDDNLEEIPRLIELSKKLGITYLVTLYSNGRGTKANRILNLDVSRYLLDLQKRYPEFISLPGYIRQFSEAIRNNGIYPCRAGKNLFNIDCQGNVSRCIDTLDDPVGNILHDDGAEISKRLYTQYVANKCGNCWTSCRGSVESVMYGQDRLKDCYYFYEMTRAVPLQKAS